MRFPWIAVFVVFLGAAAGPACTTLAAEESPWRTYSGGFASRWNTTERHHGHDQPWCLPPEVREFPFGRSVGLAECDSSDFRTGNLDNSIGFRAGRERDLASVARLRLTGGFEGSVSFSEYNISQREMTLFAGSLTTGADLDLRGARLGVRVGAGPFATSDSRTGLQVSRALHATLPLRPGAALRVSRHDVRLSHFWAGGESPLVPIDHDGVDLTETSIMIVASGDAAQPSGWELGATLGATTPGLGGSEGLGLRTGPFHRLAIARDLPLVRTQAVLSWTSSAHESRVEGVFQGYDGNFRSKTIDGFGLALRRAVPIRGRLELSWGGGVEGADWSDEHGLLVERDRVIEAGIELALSANGAARWSLRRGLALEARGDYLLWTGIGLSEFRYGFGLVLTR